MNKIFLILAANSLSAAFVAIAGYMAIKGIGGWGWFFAGSLITAHCISNSNGNDKT